MSRILRHVGNKDFKRTRQRQIGEQKERAAKKLMEEKIFEQLKSDWRSELGNPNSWFLKACYKYTWLPSGITQYKLAFIGANNHGELNEVSYEGPAWADGPYK